MINRNELQRRRRLMNRRIQDLLAERRQAVAAVRTESGEPVEQSAERRD